MGTRKKSLLELIFNLQWRYNPDNGGDKSNVIGMYDTSATILNFETFKSYLLKNSGVAGNDVKVTYLTDDRLEWVIEDQTDFEIALSAFRLKARLGEVIFLKLNIISGSGMAAKRGGRKISNDAETQSEDHVAERREAHDGPPNWFLNYMVQFKRDVVEEVTYGISSNIISTTKKEREAPSLAYPVFKRTKPEVTSKRSRRHMVSGDGPIDKDLLKTIKYDRKLDIKLDKLDAKTKKIKEKKQALVACVKNLDLDDTKPPKKHSISLDADGKPLMNGCLVSGEQQPARMMGGEIYLHTWQIVNSGNLPWPDHTELRLTWGSAEFKPSAKVIRCPPLKPGEKGSINMRFIIPENPGLYESYWNFYNDEVRFGHWLSCLVLVEPLRINQSKKQKIEQAYNQFTYCLHDQQVSNVPERSSSPCSSFPMGIADKLIRYENDRVAAAAAVSDNKVVDLSVKKEFMNPFYESSDMMNMASNKYGIDDEELVVDLSNCKINDVDDEKGQTEEAVVITIGHDDNNNNGASCVDHNTSESISEIGSEASSEISSGYDVIVGPVCEEKDESGYVYITIDGNKLSVPKHILRPELVASAEKAPEPKSEEDIPESASQLLGLEQTEQATTALGCSSEDLFREINKEAAKLQAELLNLEHNVQDTKSFVSHCSTAGTCFSSDTVLENMENSRLFIFPQTNPGFEVVMPKSDDEKKVEDESKFRPEKFVFFPHDGGCPTNIGGAVQKVEGKFNPHAEKIDYFCPGVEPLIRGERFLYFPQDVSCPTSRAEGSFTDPLQTYSWAQSQTQYTMADLQNSAAADAANNIKYDPYGPLEQARGAASPAGSNTSQSKLKHIPNYQQSLPKAGIRCNKKVRTIPVQQQTSGPATPSAPPPSQSSSSNSQQSSMQSVPVHILPENLVSGAVNVASSAINTARSVINMMIPPKSDPGRWVNGHFVIDNPESTRAKNIRTLAEMGFWDTDLNATLLARYNDDLSRVVTELVQ